MNTTEIGFGYRPRADYASDPAQTRGRLVPEPESATRTPFQRDRDRIIHSTAFRRLKHKTQVFIAHEGDHFRTRLTHSIEVAQIARALARALRLDEDLAEAVALVHDFGHTPFGHTGEDALDEKMRPWGGFDHNAQSMRIVTELERRYADFDGLNLSWETLEGLVKHNGPLTGDIPPAIVEYNLRHDLELDRHAGLEAQAAAIADDIAYDTHDIDDGLRAGLISLDMLEEVPLCAGILAGVRRQYPALDPVRTAHELMRRQITLMVEDVIATASDRIERLAPRSASDVHTAGTTLVTFSEPMRRAEAELKSFLYGHLYRHPQVMRVRASADLIVRELFDRYMADDTALPDDWRDPRALLDEGARARLVGDFLAGMTDTYALREHRRLFDHTPDLG
ncbi:deoxyguanosinetriphosphate triphosphohydrolase [Mesorhizobium sp. YIM 152430]|uniref:deoxyguanosinetriphosphate triphosphohydrolase n=1 Tax=Mesorhizobium sp. YIM 152430 TaxID=3031761 RepID=UPI0023DAC281|nr:deoxyguanosinetriphosphate triphosphohydrolase [Mesorhizobium sp. YIM 152430]MDF1600016.1 deoxyguanosinetriphosphate triphosphohydrolase [Mesorhizobium sp. YIM 152430]